MHSHIRAGFIIAAAASLMSSAALAQTAQPKAGSSATTVTSTTTTVTATKWMTQEAAGQWRASKLIGLNVYNNDNEKIGIAELRPRDSIDPDQPVGVPSFVCLGWSQSAQGQGDIMLKAGQLLYDNDPRYRGRKVEIVRIEGSYAICKCGPRQTQIRLASIFSDGVPRRSGYSTVAPNDSEFCSTSDTQP